MASDPSWLSTPTMRASRPRSTESVKQQAEGRRLDGIFLHGLQIGIFDGERMPVGHDAQRARRRVVESDLTRPLHVEAAGRTLIVGVDLLEAALQIGDAVEIGIDAIYRLRPALRRSEAWRWHRLNRGLPAGALVRIGRFDLLHWRDVACIIIFNRRTELVLCWSTLDRFGGDRTFPHCRSPRPERRQAPPQIQRRAAEQRVARRLCGLSLPPLMGPARLKAGNSR